MNVTHRIDTLPRRHSRQGAFRLGAEKGSDGFEHGQFY
jgi:hypothetical protein